MILKKRTSLSVTRFSSVVLLVAIVANPVLADQDDTMTKTAKHAQDIQSKLIPAVQIPLSYNYNQNTQPNQGLTQAQFQLTPIIPVIFDGSTGFVLNPMFIDNINIQNQSTTNQATPLQLASYIVHKTDTSIYGVGPFVQMPTAHKSSGSQQTGLGVSYGFLYRPKHWVIGATGYQAWGVGGDASYGTANVYYVNPQISFTTDNAWTYNLQSWINGNPTSGQSNNTNQLILSTGKTLNLGKTTVQWMIGPAYMVTNTPTSPQGWGGYASLTIAFME